jgi:hypothetical protein
MRFAKGDLRLLAGGLSTGVDDLTTERFMRCCRGETGLTSLLIIGDGVAFLDLSEIRSASLSLEARSKASCCGVSGRDSSSICCSLQIVTLGRILCSSELRPSERREDELAPLQLYSSIEAVEDDEPEVSRRILAGRENGRSGLISSFSPSSVSTAVSTIHSLPCIQLNCLLSAPCGIHSVLAPLYARDGDSSEPEKRYWLRAVLEENGEPRKEAA